jgi:cell wall-associated NlpC family hydrolase
MFDPLVAAEPFVGIPYKLHGVAPPAWDCRGCMAYVRAEVFGRPSPSARDAFPAAEGLRRAALAEFMAVAIAERLALWRPVTIRPGAAVLLRWFGRPSHVGVVLNTAGDFMHVQEEAATVIDRLGSEVWTDERVAGFYDA